MLGWFKNRKKYKRVSRAYGQGAYRRGVTYRGKVSRKKIPVLKPIVSVFAVMFLCAALVGVWHKGASWLLSLNLFSVTDISVSGLVNVPREDVIEASGLYYGVNLNDIKTEQVERKVESIPWVAKAECEINLPSRVVIRVEEHKPFAIINMKEGGERGLFYVDGDGVLFARVTAGDDLDYPVISADYDLDLSLGEKVADESQLKRSLYFLKLTKRGNAFLPFQAVSQLFLDSEEGLVLFLSDYSFPIYMGKKLADEQVRLYYNRLVRMMDTLYRKDEMNNIKEIRMDYSEFKALVAQVER